jgi:ABC-type branched-subunit amino acid transport system substrate-binding protein
MEPRKGITAACAAAVLLLASCGGRDDDAADDAATSAAEAPATTAAEGPGTTESEASATTEAAATTEPAEEPEATEIGVTADEIRIGVVADVDTPVSPALSQPLVRAVEGWAEQVNADGGLAGRQVVVTHYDSKLNPDEATNAYTQACQNEFATVGSGAFVLLNPAPIQTCADQAGNAIGLPDLAALAISPGAATSPTTYGLILAGQDFTAAEPTYRVSTYGWDYLTEQLGGATPKMLGIDPGVPGQREGILAFGKALEQRGGEFVGSVTFPDVAPQSDATAIVNQIRNEGINWVNSISIGISKIMAEARVQGLDTSSIIWTCTSQCQTPTFLEQGGDAVEGLYVSQLLTPWTETGVEGVAAYREAVADADVSSNGETAFGAALAFQEIVEAMVEERGVNSLTRQSLLDALAAGPEVTARGILAEGTVLGQPTTCWATVQVQGGEFVRADPPGEGEFACDENVIVQVTGPLE